jgi:uncharacterized membrane protein YqiK
MIVMLAGMVVVVLLVAVFVLGGWWMRRRVRSVRRVEARVVARLMAGVLTAAGYREAMAGLAADDAVRHPLVVPDR